MSKPVALVLSGAIPKLVNTAIRPPGRANHGCQGEVRASLPNFEQFLPTSSIRFFPFPILAN